MKKVLVGSLAAMLVVLAFAGSAQAKCGDGCLNRKIVRLSKRLGQAEKTIKAQAQTISQQSQAIAGQGQTIAAQGQAIGKQGQTTKEVESFLFGCVFEAPLSVYGDSEGNFGYLFDNETETIKTTALDVTDEGDFIEAWALFDGCNPETVLSSSAGGTPSASGTLGETSGELGDLLRPLRFP